MDDARDLRQRLHERAERSGQEQRTARLLREWLTDRGVRVETHVGGPGCNGLLATVGGGEDDEDGPAAGPIAGPVRLLRAELDALPTHDGARHGCGHDGHMAMLAGALARLAADPGDLPRPVVALFQPAEENGTGMARCLQDRRLADLDVHDCYSIHNVPGEPTGRLLLGPGALASTGIQVRLVGLDSHAAHPAEGVSPWRAVQEVADVVPGLHDRERGDPHALATLIHVRLGEEAYGTSPGRGIVGATLRGAGASVESMRERLLEAAEAAAGPHRLDLDWTEVDPFPETRNDGDALDAARRAADAAGIEVADRAEPFPWSEDFGHATARWPGALLGLGSGVDRPPLHDDEYVFPDALLDVGIRFWETLGRSP